MTREFKLPDLGEGLHEGEILKVLVKAGDEVKEGDIILQVETDKAAVEIPSPFTGRVEKVLVREGAKVQVGKVLVTFGEAEGKMEEGKAPLKAGEKKPAAPKAEEVEKEPEAEEVEEKPEIKKVEEEPEAEKPSEPSGLPGEAKEKPEIQEAEKPSAPEEGPVPASPATRRLARELGVDLREVPPSGPGGRVTDEDVKAYAGKMKKEKPEPAPEKPGEVRPLEMKAPALPDFTKWGEVEKVPLRSVRRAMARQMALAWSQIPHVHNQDMVDVTRLEDFRQNHKEKVEAKGGKLTVTVFALKAAAAALKQHPRFNASLDPQAGEIILKHYYHLGVAVSTNDGLIVPVIRDVDRKSILELSVELNDLVKRTRERKVNLEEMQGGTFTITNVGSMGGGYFAPIINYPEAAILGMGTARMVPVVKETEGRHEIIPRLLMPVVLCIDHRILDGADALDFMRTLAKALEDPDELFMTMT